MRRPRARPTGLHNQSFALRSCLTQHAAFSAVLATRRPASVAAAGPSGKGSETGRIPDRSLKNGSLIMASAKDVQYLLVVEWEDQVQHRGIVVEHRFTLPAGVPPAEFEKLVTETVLPGMANSQTRVGAIANAYFL